MALMENIKEQMKTRFIQILSAQKVRLPAATTRLIQQQLMEIIESAKGIYDSEITTYLSQIGRFQAEVNELREENAKLKTREKMLTQEALKNSNRIKALEDRRPKFTPEQLSFSFQQAMERMEEAFKASKDSNVTYSISDFDVELKGNVTIEDKQVIIKTPNIAEEIATSALSTLRFRIIKEPRIMEEKAMIMVPNLVGSTKEAAIKVAENAGLKIEEIVEMESLNPPGTVIGQSPDPFSNVEPGFPLSLILSLEVVDVPNLVGMTREDAEKSLTKLGLKLGKKAIGKTDVKAGVVISQSVTAKTKVHKGTSIDVVVSGKRRRER